MPDLYGREVGQMPLTTTCIGIATPVEWGVLLNSLADDHHWLSQGQYISHLSHKFATSY